MRISDRLISLETAIKLALGDAGVRVQIYDGTVGEKQVNKLSLKLPAVLISCTESQPTPVAKENYLHGSIGPDSNQPVLTWHTELSLAAAVLANDKPSVDKSSTAWNVVDQITAPLLQAGWGLRWRNAYSQPLWQRGIIMVMANWRERIEFTPADAARFDPAVVQVNQEEVWTGGA